MDDYKYQQAAVAVEADYGGAAGQFRGKQGHTCCGCCCDTRRAVIISNLVMVVIQILTGSLLIAGVELVEAAAKQADDDQVIDAGKQLEQMPMGLVVLLMLVSIILHGLGVQGAIAYKKWMVCAAMGSYAINLVLSVFQFNIVGIFVNLSLVYPHFYFIKEMNEQIMTPENYPNEVQSCCCV